MTLFSIECATCHAKLNVREPSLIGQILACPKCGSMVMVEAPEGYEPPADDDNRDPSEEIAERRPSSHDSRADTKPMAVPQPEELGSGPTRPLPPGSDWSSQESKQMRRLLVLSGIGVGVVILSVAIIGFWMSRSQQVAAGDPQQAVDTGTSEPANDPSTDTDDGASQSDLTPGQDSSSDTGGDASDKEADGGAEPPAVGGETTGANSDNTADDASSDNTGSSANDASANNNSADDASPETGAASETTGSSAKTNQSSPDAAANPPGFASEPSEPARDQEAEAAAASLRRLEQLLAPEADSEDRPERIVIEKRSAIPLAEKPQPRNIDIPVQLRRPVLAMNLENVPLIRFLRFLSEMSTIPITLDPVALRAKGIRANAPVSVDLEDTTIEGILRAAIEPLGLGLESGPNVVRVSLADGDQPVAFDVSDLVEDNPQQLAALAAWVANLVEPASWTNTGGKGSLSVEGKSLRVKNAPRVRYQVGRLLERIRVARSLPTKYGLPPSELSLDTPPEREFLTQPITANFGIPRYVGDLLSEVSEQTNVDILVDWEAVARAGWNPDGKVRLRVEDESLADALQRLMQSMELDFKVVGERMIVITDPDSSRAAAVTLLHPCGSAMEVLNDDEQAMSQFLAAKMGAENFRPAGGPISVFYDPRCKRLLVSAPLAGQLKIAKLLADVARPVGGP